MKPTLICFLSACSYNTDVTHAAAYAVLVHLLLIQQINMGNTMTAVLQKHNFCAWHTTDRSWLISSADSVRREKSFVCPRKIGQFFLADKSWPTNNIFKCVWKYDDISAEIMYCDWSEPSVWNILAAERCSDDQIYWSIRSQLISIWSRRSKLSEPSFVN